MFRRGPAIAHADVLEVLEHRRLVEQTHHDALAVAGRHGRETDVDVAAGDLDLDAAVLRDALLGDVEAGHDLDAAGDRRGEPLGRPDDLVEHAVHAEPHRDVSLERLDVDVAGALFDGLRHQRVDEADDGRLVVRVDDVDVDVLDVLAGDPDLLVVDLAHDLAGAGAAVEDLVDRVDQHTLGHDRPARSIASSMSCNAVQARATFRGSTTPTWMRSPLRQRGRTSCVRANWTGMSFDRSASMASTSTASRNANPSCSAWMRRIRPSSTNRSATRASGRRTFFSSACRRAWSSCSQVIALRSSRDWPSSPA
jgi:hypothetical protein